MSHSGSSFGYRCIAVTVVHNVLCLECFTISRGEKRCNCFVSLPRDFRDSYFKIMGQDFAKRAHFRPFENLEEFLRIFSPIKSETKSCSANLVKDQYKICSHENRPIAAVLSLYLRSHHNVWSSTYSKSEDQPGKVANPARGQLSKEN